MTIFAGPQIQFQKENLLAIVECHHTSGLPTDQQFF
jgi:hypothetical protein